MEYYNFPLPQLGIARQAVRMKIFPMLVMMFYTLLVTVTLVKQTGIASALTVSESLKVFRFLVTILCVVGKK